MVAVAKDGAIMTATEIGAEGGMTNNVATDQDMQTDTQTGLVAGGGTTHHITHQLGRSLLTRQTCFRLDR